MLRKTKTALLAALMVAAVSTQAAAQDQEAGDIRVDLPTRKAPPREEGPLNTSRRNVGTPGPLRVYGGFNLQVGGGLTRTDSEFFEGTADLDPTVGLQFGVDYVLHKYFSIGGETRFLWWKPEGAADRNFLWDLAVKPRGRYAFANIPLEVYGALPIGLSVAGLAGEDLEGGAGFNVGLLGGANYFFNSRMAINAEIGWQFHRFSAEFRGIDAGSYKMNQFVLLCPNFVYVL